MTILNSLRRGAASTKVVAGVAVISVSLLAYYLAWYATQKPTPAPVATAPATIPAPPVIAAKAANGVLTITYKGAVLCTASPSVMPAIKQVSPKRIDLTVAGAGGVWLDLGQVTLPGDPTNIDGEWDGSASAERGPVVSIDSGPWGLIAFASAGADAVITNKHAAPGGTHENYRAVGIFGTAGAGGLTLSICVDDEPLGVFTDAFVAAHPPKLIWKDKRPILMTATDPSRSLGKTLAAQAADAIAAAKAMPGGGGQGVIYWALDNQSDESGRKYLGCPELINQLRPAGDTLETLAAAHAAAKMPWGVCVRPWSFTVNAAGAFTLTGGDTRTLAAKLAYLQRLGATIIYIDSCPLDSSRWLVDLQAQFPLMLLIPEGGNTAQMAAGAPLRECANGSFQPLTNVYPAGFITLLHPSGLTDAQLATVKAAGAVPLIEPWDTATMNRWAK